MTQSWAEGLHRRIAGAIKAARGERSAQWLADETARLGYPISRSTLANYESGRKKGLDIAELIVIARALQVPPVVLLYPDIPEGSVELSPDTGEVDSWSALQWFAGEEATLAELERSRQEGATVADGTILIAAVREGHGQIGQLGELISTLTNLNKHLSGPQLLPAVKEIGERGRKARQELAQTARIIVNHGGTILRGGHRVERASDWGGEPAVESEEDRGHG